MSRAALVSALAALVLCAVPGAGAERGVPSFRHVVVIVFENHEHDNVLGSKDAPTFNALARRYAQLSHTYAMTHPSLPNYLALVSGSTKGITSDCEACVVRGYSLADTLEASWKTWKTYAEDLPRPGYVGPSVGNYPANHVPFRYFRNVRSAPGRRARIVPLTAFAPDLALGKLPAFSLVVPNLCHSMHECGVAAGDRWLRSFVQPLLRSPEMRSSIVLVTFDEGTTNASGGGHIPTLVLGPLVRPGAKLARAVNTFGLLRMIEDGLHLPLLGKSGGEHPMTGIWR